MRLLWLYSLCVPLRAGAPPANKRAQESETAADELRSQLDRLRGEAAARQVADGEKIMQLQQQALERGRRSAEMESELSALRCQLAERVEAAPSFGPAGGAEAPGEGGGGGELAAVREQLRAMRSKRAEDAAQIAMLRAHICRLEASQAQKGASGSSCSTAGTAAAEHEEMKRKEGELKQEIEDLNKQAKDFQEQLSHS